MRDSFPLTERGAEQPFSYHYCAERGRQLRTVADYLALAEGVAAAIEAVMPSAAFVLNYCDNRYLFQAAFGGALLAGRTTLLPPNRTRAVAGELLARYPATLILHDGQDQGAPAGRSLDVRTIAPLTSGGAAAAPIAGDFPAAICFSSGTTGAAKTIAKSWRTLAVSARLNARYMVPPTDAPLQQLATVPLHHMWGLETAVMLPLVAPICAAGAAPLYPQDIRRELALLPEPRQLVTTPIHLRSLKLSGLDFGVTRSVLCATAPLPRDLAGWCEQALQAELIEIYGCSEVGSLAWRRSAQSAIWHLFDSMTAAPLGSGEWQLQAPHLPQPVILPDHLAPAGERAFELRGRFEDTIQVAGKRGSLAELNLALLSVPEVQDGVVLMPPEEGPLARPAALVVSNAADVKARIRAVFRERFDPVFLPRPILLVPALPREPNGKLARAKLLELYGQVCRPR